MAANTLMSTNKQTNKQTPVVCTNRSYYRDYNHTYYKKINGKNRWQYSMLQLDGNTPCYNYMATLHAKNRSQYSMLYIHDNTPCYN